jgi:hypothetical protein
MYGGRLIELTDDVLLGGSVQRRPRLVGIVWVCGVLPYPLPPAGRLVWFSNLRAVEGALAGN